MVNSLVWLLLPFGCWAFFMWKITEHDLKHYKKIYETLANQTNTEKRDKNE
jgi:hypothetical protein